jgi:NADH:ubiquinone oxidoreductase subunit 2 (subunit N)
MLFEYIPGVLKYIVIVGAATSFFAATTGLLQNDLKRVIAYSTCSQLLRPYRFSIRQSRLIGRGWQFYTTGYISVLLLNEATVIGLMNSQNILSALTKMKYKVFPVLRYAD